MKNAMTTREKILLCILGIMGVVLLYYYLFYIPMTQQTEQYRQDYITVDETLIVVEAKATKMAQMQAEIAAIKAGSTEGIKELPHYDNRQSLMSQLSEILENTEKYSINFGSITGDGTTISRQVTLNYTCDDYASAKGILEKIYDGDYPCAYGNLSLSNKGASVAMYITYYEYGKLQ